VIRPVYFLGCFEFGCINATEYSEFPAFGLRVGVGVQDGRTHGLPLPSIHHSALRLLNSDPSQQHNLLPAHSAQRWTGLVLYW